MHFQRSAGLQLSTLVNLLPMHLVDVEIYVRAIERHATGMAKNIAGPSLVSHLRHQTHHPHSSPVPSWRPSLLKWMHFINFTSTLLPQSFKQPHVWEMSWVFQLLVWLKLHYTESLTWWHQTSAVATVYKTASRVTPATLPVLPESLARQNGRKKSTGKDTDTQILPAFNHRGKHLSAST